MVDYEQYQDTRDTLNSILYHSRMVMDGDAPEGVLEDLETLLIIEEACRFNQIRGVHPHDLWLRSWRHNISGVTSRLEAYLRGLDDNS